MMNEQMNDVKERLYQMDEETFGEFCKNFTDEQVKIFTAMRFFRHLFNDPAFYDAVCKAVGEAAYEEFPYIIAQN